MDGSGHGDTGGLSECGDTRSLAELVEPLGGDIQHLREQYGIVLDHALEVGLIEDHDIDEGMRDDRARAPVHGESLRAERLGREKAHLSKVLASVEVAKYATRALRDRDDPALQKIHLLAGLTLAADDVVLEEKLGLQALGERGDNVLVALREERHLPKHVLVEVDADVALQCWRERIEKLIALQVAVLLPGVLVPFACAVLQG
mmetsp:Transcript_54076/g.139686  ORF Transcript_54076/g.139686 Transcript_54076/m.139686 type:complete len:204 (-) Transcript_54076:403-1014(-)